MFTQRLKSSPLNVFPLAVPAPQVISPQVSKVHLRSSFPTSFHICFPPPDKSFCHATSCSLKALLCRQNLGDTTYKYTTMLELNIWCAAIIWLHICVRFWRKEAGGARINAAMCSWQIIHTIVFPLSRINSVILTSLIDNAQYSVGNRRGSWNFKRTPFKQKLIHGHIIIQKAPRDFSTSFTWSIGFMDFISAQGATFLRFPSL